MDVEENGLFDFKKFEVVMCDDIVFVSVMYVNNELGVI